MNPELVPLWLLYEDELPGWLGSQAPFFGQWLGAQGYKAERHRVALIPDSHGRLAAAVGGLGKRHAGLSLWHAAGLAERLPAHRFALAQDFTSFEATQLALGFEYAAYRFERYRSGKTEQGARLEAPANADRQYVALAAAAPRAALVAGRRAQRSPGGVDRQGCLL